MAQTHLFDKKCGIKLCTDSSGRLSLTLLCWGGEIEIETEKRGSAPAQESLSILKYRTIRTGVDG